MKTFIIILATFAATVIGAACLLAWLMGRTFPPGFVASAALSAGMIGFFLGATFDSEDKP